MRKRKQYIYSSLQEEDARKWEELCPTGEFRVMSPNEFKNMLPDALPDKLVSKYDSVLVIASGISLGGGADVVCYMANGNRVDFKDNAIDQMPFGFILSRAGLLLPSGCLIQHGDWEERTAKPPEEFWDYALESGIGHCFPIQELPEQQAGTIDDIKIQSQHDALADLFTELKRRI